MLRPSKITNPHRQMPRINNHHCYRMYMRPLLNFPAPPRRRPSSPRYENEFPHPAALQYRCGFFYESHTTPFALFVGAVVLAATARRARSQQGSVRELCRLPFISSYSYSVPRGTARPLGPDSPAPALRIARRYTKPQRTNRDVVSGPGLEVPAYKVQSNRHAFQAVA